MIDVILKPARVSSLYFYVKVTRFLKRYQVSCHEIENGLVLSFYAQQNTRYVSKFCVNPNWHEAGNFYPRCNFGIGFCQLNLYQKFPNMSKLAI